MFPVLLELGPFTLYTYGLSLVAAFFLTAYLARRSSQKFSQRLLAVQGDQILDLFTWLLVGGIIGGRLFYVWLHLDVFQYQPLEAFAIWQGGLVWYGGFIGGLITAWIYAKVTRIPILKLTDQLVPYVALGHAVGRLGCFANGCCYGRPTDAWYGVRFAGHPYPVIPTQLIEAAGLGAVYWVLRRAQDKGWLCRRGLVTGSYLLMYAILRFCVEFVRGDQDTFWTGLTLQQYISVILAFAGCSLMAQGNLRAANPDAS